MTDIDALLDPDSVVVSFEDWVLPLMPGLLAYFVRRVVPVGDAADCLSETIVVLWRRRLDIPREDEQARAWAFGVARRVLSGHRRTKVRQERLSGRLRHELTVSSEADSPASLDESLRDALDLLRPADKELVLLVAWDGFGVAAAGALLRMNPAVARARYSRARRTLREALAPPSEI